MVKSHFRQLNPFELKAEIIAIISKFEGSKDISSCIEDISLLDAQNDKRTIVKLLLKELYNLKTEDGTIICFLLERYADKAELTKKLWELLKNPLSSNNVKIITLNFLRGLDNNWELDCGDELLNTEILDAETSKMLNNAIVNPEIQIDFLDFLTSLSTHDKITLINSLANDYSEDTLANILIPVFQSQPTSEAGLAALDILGKSKSQLAYHALNSSLEQVDERIKPLVKKNISTLKISGIREDNSAIFYKEILSESLPYKFYATYPDGHGNQAIIFTRKTVSGKIRFVAVVIDDYHGIRDCFGFNEISEFECEKIIERFFKNESELELSPKDAKTILLQAERLSKTANNNWLMPYEYVCWRNLLADIDSDKRTFKEILSESLEKKKLTQNDLEKIFEMQFTKKWFLEGHYSDEFEELLQKGTSNLDGLVDEYLYKIFYEEEKLTWQNRLLSAAFLKQSIGEKTDAELLYSLYHDDDALTSYFKTILKRSIYEYYLSLKYNTDLNNGQYTLNELNEIIKEIEGLWTCTK